MSDGKHEQEPSGIRELYNRLTAGRATRLQYLLILLLLLGGKIAFDFAVTSTGWPPPLRGGSSLSVLMPYTHYAFWSSGARAAGQDLAILLLTWLPLLIIWYVFTIRRLRDAALPAGYGFLIFVPYVNVLLAVALLFAPPFLPGIDGRWRFRRSVSADMLPLEQRAILRRDWHTATLRASLITSAISISLIWFGTSALRTYGNALFIGIPLIMFFIPAALVPASVAGVPGARITATLASAGLVLVGLLAFRIEGLVCIIMASPLLLLMWIIAAVAHSRTKRWFTQYGGPATLLFTMALPVAMAAEAALDLPVNRRSRTTRTVIKASPQTLWPLIQAQPSLPPIRPRDVLFQLGVAYPVRTEMIGTGVGSSRRCILSTGPMDEIVDVWEPNRRLAFRVTAQPPPMHELSPFSDFHAPHFDDCFRCERGEFRLLPLPDGRTELRGTTWYTTRIWPAAYWHLWTDAIVTNVHRRVFKHIEALAEAPH